MSKGHYFKATLANGVEWMDPSEDLLFELFGDIERGDIEFFTVEKLSDGTGQTFVQAIVDADRQWIVEYRDGSPEAHYSSRFDGLRDAHAVMTAWCFGHDPALLEAIEWERVTF